MKRSKLALADATEIAILTCFLLVIQAAALGPWDGSLELRAYNSTQVGEELMGHGAGQSSRKLPLFLYIEQSYVS